MSPNDSMLATFSWMTPSKHPTVQTNIGSLFPYAKILLPRPSYHESIANLAPANVYFGRGQTILIERERIKGQTIDNRRLLHRRQAA
jgi:hypothetical protein